MNLSDTDSESESTEDGGREVTIEEQLLWSTLHTALTSNHWASRFKAGQYSLASLPLCTHCLTFAPGPLQLVPSPR